jgi:hypothetical protein
VKNTNRILVGDGRVSADQSCYLRLLTQVLSCFVLYSFFALAETKGCFGTPIQHVFIEDVSKMKNCMLDCLWALTAFSWSFLTNLAS